MDGEDALPNFLKHFENKTHQKLEKVIRSPRYPFSVAKMPRFDLMDKKESNYYGAVVEVSRGCPFLCEFCDIRVLPNNNQTNTKDIPLIIREIDEHYKRGITKFQFACDNFIGDTKWAHACCDALLQWKEETGANVSLFTWLTVNLYKMPTLMKKMRQIGFSILFIGIESVNNNSLLETAKVQNMNVLEEAVETIHSYGFIIAPGLIFGFDSDTENVFQDTLDFIVKTGTIGGDPSFLTALAGTPLYARMKKGGRLIERKEGAIERKKITTNIRYLQDKDFLANGFSRFVKEFNNPSYQYARFKNYVALVIHSPHFIPNHDSGYASPLPYLKRQIKNLGYMTMLWNRIRYLSRVDRLWTVFKGWRLIKKHAQKAPGLATHFFYWLYVWTNMALKYKGLQLTDFALNSVDETFDRTKVVEDAQMSKAEREENQKEGIKVDIQSRYTTQALKKLVQTEKAVSQ